MEPEETAECVGTAWVGLGRGCFIHWSLCLLLFSDSKGLFNVKDANIGIAADGQPPFIS
jgi:hypothetical protein